MYHKPKVLIMPVLFCCILPFFFYGLFQFDNKYQTPPPYGHDGILSLSEEDFSRKTPIYLIDGWLLTDNSIKRQQTYIGEFSNLQRGNMKKAPHGKAIYELVLRYSGTPRIVALDFPELFSKYKIYIDGELKKEGIGSARVLFSLHQGDNRLTVETLSRSGYYSGMYYPASLGDETALLHAERIKTLVYSVCVFCTLVLLSFTIQLWRRKEGDEPTFWLAWLCICFACYVSYYFIHLFSLSFAPIWYYIEDLSLYSLVFCMIRLISTIAGFHQNKTARITTAAFVLLPVVLLLLHAMIPYQTQAVWLHGQIKNLYFILIFFWLLGTSVLCIRWKRSEYPYVIGGSLIFGIGLILNLFQSNLFEPIYSLWQFEWCGLLLVWLFAHMMITRNRRILREHRQLTNHLESLVEQRTEELNCVLQERRAFFSDMAHDLKSPLFATKTFINAIRAHSVGLDEELAYYLDQLDSKQSEMSKRVQSLNTLNALDKVEGKRERLSIHEILDEVYLTHKAEADVSAVHFCVHPPSPDCFVFIQQEKLMLAFENLFFNALRATPPDGNIIITGKCDENTVKITIDDTGCGISEAELPFIFKRFYVGEQNKASGSGLGLYIVKTVFEEVGGKVSASSQLGYGTRILLELPICL